LICQVIRGNLERPCRWGCPLRPPSLRGPACALLDSASEAAYHLGVTESVGTRRKQANVEWLTAEELHSWLAVVRLMTWVPWSVDQQLQRDSGLAMVEYQVLAMLSQPPLRTMRMSSLADVTNASLSRLSRVVTRLEDRGLVRREADPMDGRFTNAILTDDGYRTLVEAAPGHVAEVRRLVIDVLSPEQLRRLGRDAERIMARIDRSTIN
jgi:DNA-binding MarR family transcriptional regulator